MTRRILFISSDNASRSQMAEGMARHFLGHQADVGSGGITAATKVNHMAVAVMAEIGIDISHYHPKDLGVFELSRYNLVVVFATDAKALLLPPQLDGTKKIIWDISPPATADLSPEDQLRKFRKVRDDIRKHVLELRAADQVW